MLNTIETKFVVCPLGRNGKLSRDLNLPYIRACILEVMRLRTTVPLSIPRSATCDAVVNGYHIPKGTEVCKKVSILFMLLLLRLKYFVVDFCTKTRIEILNHFKASFF